MISLHVRGHITARTYLLWWFSPIGKQYHGCIHLNEYGRPSRVNLISLSIYLFFFTFNSAFPFQPQFPTKIFVNNICGIIYVFFFISITQTSLHFNRTRWSLPTVCVNNQTVDGNKWKGEDSFAQRNGSSEGLPRPETLQNASVFL